MPRLLNLQQEPLVPHLLGIQERKCHPKHTSPFFSFFKKYLLKSLRSNCINFITCYSWAYRSSGSHYLSKKHFMAAELIGAVMWYWVLIHLWHEPEHITVVITSK